MRWADLFRDLEAQLEAAEAADADAEVADRSRLAAGQVTLADRARAGAGAAVVLSVRGVGRVAGRLVDAGDSWLLVEDEAAHQVLVVVAAVTTAAGLPVGSAPPEPAATVSGRLGLAGVLRGVARDRAEVVLSLVDGTQLVGTVDRVAADHLDVTPAGDGPVARAAGPVVVPTAALAVLRPAW